MPFGRGDKSTLKRMVSVSVEGATELKRLVFEKLRVAYIALLNDMVEAAWVDPLDESRVMDDKALGKALFAIQKTAVSGGMRSVYAERARLDVNAKIREQWKRFEKGLRWRLGNAAREIDDEKKTRRWYAVPQEIENSIAVSELEQLAEYGKWERERLLCLFRGEANVALSEGQRIVLGEILEQTRRRCGKPLYREDATIQLMMDDRWWSKKSPFADGFGSAVKVLIDGTNRHYRSFLSLTHPFGEGRVKLPLSAVPGALKRLLAGNEERRSLVLEIGPGKIAFRVVFAKVKPSLDIASRTAIVGRDFGYSKTISLTAIEADCSGIEQVHGEVEKLDKAGARAWMENKTHSPRVLETVQLSGRRFLDAIHSMTERIDRLRSDIDKGYDTLDAMKGALVARLGLSADDRIEPSMEGGKPFLALLASLQTLKMKRRRLYDRIRSLKKVWMGHVSNRELKLAEKHNAVLVREDLTVVAAEKDKPGYKGRTFNKMINNGSKGQYLARASNKLIWNGVPELAIPSFYTSTFCHLTGVVDKRQRRGDTFTSRLGGYVRNSDLHASETIACYLLLTPQAST